jgi:hypothetical protein
MREISPAENMTVDEFFQTVPDKLKGNVLKIRAEKTASSRPVPSAKLIDKSQLLNSQVRLKLIDKVSALVDENLFGRSEMCIQFSMLLNPALVYLELPSKTIMGKAIYFNSGKEIFRWDHAWVRIGNEVIDGNVDILFENPAIPNTVDILPYWGPVNNIPQDRRLREDRNKSFPSDMDVDNIWWPELKSLIDTEIKSIM